jgi:hypothetical protein
MEWRKNLNIRVCTCIGILLFLPFLAGRALSQPLIESTPHGIIDWTLGVVWAYGSGSAGGGVAGESLDLQTSAALENARENLLQVLKRVRIDAEDTVEDLSKIDSRTMSQIRDMLAGIEARRAKPAQGARNGVQVSLKMSFRGGFAQLVLPAEIMSIAPLKQVGGKSSPPPPDKPDGLFTGLIVDATRLTAHPAMAPTIMDENGEAIFGSAFASREFAVQRGMTGYAADLETARNDTRVGGHPLVAKALAVSSGRHRCDLVVSNADAARLRKFSEHLLFLRECRVVIVLRPQAVGDRQ